MITTCWILWDDLRRGDGICASGGVMVGRDIRAAAIAFDGWIGAAAATLPANATRIATTAGDQRVGRRTIIWPPPGSGETVCSLSVRLQRRAGIVLPYPKRWDKV